ncbi:MAG: asparagine synthase (glutamine-hydrolyzing) [Candidatus Omnitrophica bacterium]|nr:asparagine synthase (glutamine-hydrolyzing) [Candidatus Omnitrophota bacterium]
MCGIVGLVDRAGRPIAEALVRQMCERMIHRGPDERGVAFFPRDADAARDRGARAALGIQRLSIIDVQGGHQPIANEDQTIWTVCNGEIYNFRELRQVLEQKGHRFATRSDTEVIVHLYEEDGEAFVNRLEGMFALAVWDDRRQRLLLARDRFGKKPLLYAELAGRLVFASEFQALLSDPSISRELDVEALHYYLTYMAIPAPLSIYRSVRKLPPAHLLIYDRTGTRLKRYWSLAYTPKLAISETDAAQRLLELLTQAVRKRLVADVPLGAFLSGGVDSSAVVALMARCSERPVKTFSIGFEEMRYNELPHARRVAQAFGCEHHEFVVRPQALEVLPTLIQHFGEPFADSSAIPTYYLSRLTREHVTVALNGDGGDEAFAGYGRHAANRLAEQWQAVPSAARRPVEWLVARWPSVSSDRQRLPGRLQRFLQAAASSRAGRYERWVGVMEAELRSTVAGRPTGALNHGMIEQLCEATQELDAVDAALAVDTAFYLPTDLLVKMDIMSMANSLEARSPFLDHHVVEFAARLPSSMKLRRLTSKALLKRALAGLLPDETLHRRKWGFAVPISAWFRTELRGMLEDVLLASQVARDGLLRQDGVTALVQAHLSGRADYAHQLWTLLMLELWVRR